MVHVKCAEPPNSWPGGIRSLRCLNCRRVFQSDSKAQRLCKACRHKPTPEFM